MTYREAFEIAKEFATKLHADHPDFNSGIIHVALDDGSAFLWDSAFARKLGKYLLVFTEHHWFHVFDEDDVVFIRQYRIQTDGHLIKDFDRGENGAR